MGALKYWVWLSAIRGLRARTKLELIEAFDSPEAVYFADEMQLLQKLRLTDAERHALSDKGLERAEEILESCSEYGVDIMTVQDAAYPSRLRNIHDAPIVLYIKGRLPAVDEEAAIAVVGTRKATPYGIKMAQRMGYELSKGGALVVTGLAAGADSAAAKGALLAGGACIGVLGCAIDMVYPAYNTEIYNDVAASGALISEYAPGTPTESRNFPERNRIISGLSLGVTVVEAPKGSGALITAARALEQGREVFAVPGNADAPGFTGSNALIKEGAQLVTEGWDILSEFEARFPQKLSRPETRKMVVLEEREKRAEGERAKENAPKPVAHQPETGKGFYKLRVKNERKKIDKEKTREYIDLRGQLEKLSESQLKIISVLKESSMHVDDIIDLSELSAPTVLSELTVLQIKGFVSQESGKRFTLNIDVNRN